MRKVNCNGCNGVIDYFHVSDLLQVSTNEKGIAYVWTEYYCDECSKKIKELGEQ